MMESWKDGKFDLAFSFSVFQFNQSFSLLYKGYQLRNS